MNTDFEDFILLDQTFPVSFLFAKFSYVAPITIFSEGFLLLFLKEMRTDILRSKYKLHELSLNSSAIRLKDILI